MATKSVAVYGATGHTGRFVVAELARRGLVPVAVGRDKAKLAVAGFSADVETRVAPIDDPELLKSRACWRCSGYQLRWAVPGYG
jgi:short subunit dehydrogenase-like uncharacterized protein